MTQNDPKKDKDWILNLEGDVSALETPVLESLVDELREQLGESRLRFVQALGNGLRLSGPGSGFKRARRAIEKGDLKKIGAFDVVRAYPAFSLKELTWISRSHRNYDVAAPQMPDGMAVKAAARWDWAGSLSSHESSLNYEPRSIAINGRCDRIAVGTKSGAIHMLVWDGQRRVWEDAEVPLSLAAVQPFSFAIRALAFLGDRQLVVGIGQGDFFIIDEDGNPKKVTRSGVGEDERGFLLRFRSIFPLFDPHPEDEVVLATGRLFACTTDDETRLHILSRLGERDFASCTVGVENFLNDWKDLDERLVSGVWCWHYLWILGSKGSIYQYKPAEGDGKLILCNSIAGKGPPRLPLAPGEGGFRSISACPFGLSVVASNHLTFIHFVKRESEGDVPRISLNSRIEGVWLSVKGILGSQPVVPFPQSRFGGSGKDKYFKRIDHNLLFEEMGKSDRVWVVAPTKHGGVKWTSWKLTSPVEKTTGSERQGHLRSPSIGYALEEPSDVTYLRIIRPRPGEAPMCVYATRSHRLCISSILNRSALDQLNWNELRGVPQEACTAVWKIKVGLNKDFANAGGQGEEPEEDRAETFGLLETNDLHRLVIRLTSRWEKYLKSLEGEPPAPPKLQAFKDWTFLILQRAHQLKPGLAANCAKRIYNILETIHSNSKYGENKLKLFMTFIRKWVSHGDTYREKEFGFGSLFIWNAACRRELDAIAYLSKLLDIRLDPVWTLRDPTPSITYDMAREESTGQGEGSESDAHFVVQALTNGEIRAVGLSEQSGHRLSWSLEREDVLENSSLVLSPDKRSLTHEEKEGFNDSYHHGPYARRLLMLRLGPDTRLLLFGTKGWRLDDTEEDERRGKRPAFHALLLKACDDKHELIILDARSIEVNTEIYGLCLDVSGDPRDESCALKSSGAFQIIVGTSGFLEWEQSRDKKPWRPFLVFDVGVAIDKDSGAFSFDEGEWANEPVFKFDARGQRSVVLDNGRDFPAAARNPCWDVFSMECDGRTWLWAAFHDGHIRCFEVKREDDAKPSIIEGGWWLKRMIFPRYAGWQVTSPVWRLKHLSSDWTGRGKEALVYGTGSGLVGAVELPLPPAKEENEKEESEKEESEKEESHIWRYLVHSDEGAPICSLVPFRDEDSRQLLVVNQNGGVSVFNLDSRIQEAQGASTAKLFLQGEHRDQFELAHLARSALVFRVKRQGTQSTSGHEFLGTQLMMVVGDDLGDLHAHMWSLPKHSLRRRRAFERRKAMLKTEGGIKTSEHVRTTALLPDILGSAPPDGMRYWCKWLRVLDLRNPHLMRFSFFHQLDHCFGTSEEYNEDARMITEPDQYRKALVALSIEASRYRSFEGSKASNQNLAKAMWTHGAASANTIAQHALEGLGDKEKLLGLHLELLKTLEGLCNQWIGYKRSTEASVLIYMFKALFSWLHVWMIGASDQSHAGLKQMQGIKRYLLRHTIQRRLMYDEPIVPLETMRTINHAIFGALHRQLIKAPDTEWSLGMRPSYDSYNLGFLDLMIMVGDLAERQKPRLSPNAPLFTELSRFIALSLLLLPDSSLLIGQVASESRLTEWQQGADRVVAEHAHDLLWHLKNLTPEASDEVFVGFEKKCLSSIRQFELYLDPHNSFILTRDEPKKESWQRLIEIALVEERSRPVPRYTNPHFLEEQLKVLMAAFWLSHLQDSVKVPGKQAGDVGVLSDKDCRKYLEELDLAALFGGGEEGKVVDRTLLSEKYKSISFNHIKAWLDDEKEVFYFKHSHKYLKTLMEKRLEIIEIITRITRNDGAADQSGTRTDKDPLVKSRKLCKEQYELLQREPDLFNPQVSHYNSLVRRWERQIEERTLEAFKILELLEAFNRHIYRTSADQLMTSIIELVFQNAPDWWGAKVPRPQDRDNRPDLVASMNKRLEGQPLLSEVFKHSVQLVDNTHVSTILLKIVAEYLERPENLKEGRDRRRTALNVVYEDLEKVCERFEVNPNKNYAQDVQIPGQRIIWEVIIQELARNAHKHSKSNQRSGAELEVGLVSEDVARVVWFRSDLSFSSGLLEQYHKKLMEVSEPKMAFDFLNGLIGFAVKHNARLHRNSHGAGYGMSMIKRICHYMGINARFELIEAGGTPGVKEPAKIDDNEEALQASLGLVVRFEAKE